MTTFSRETVLAELERLMWQHIHRSPAWDAMNTAYKFVESLPPPADVSKLVRRARAYAHDLLDESPSELCEELATALESSDSRLAAEREKVRESEDRIRTLERLVSDITTTFNERMAVMREALRHYAGTEVEIHHIRQGGMVEVPHSIDLGERARTALEATHER